MRGEGAAIGVGIVIDGGDKALETPNAIVLIPDGDG